MIARWIRDYRAHQAALYLNRRRIERERRDARAVARAMRAELGLTPHPGLGR
jgi:hypothetical protein